MACGTGAPVMGADWDSCGGYGGLEALMLCNTTVHAAAAARCKQQASGGSMSIGSSGIGGRKYGASFALTGKCIFRC